MDSQNECDKANKGIKLKLMIGDWSAQEKKKTNCCCNHISMISETTVGFN
jgi:hypothetical protein